MRLLQMDFQPLFMSGRGLRKADKSLWSKVQKDVVRLKRPMCTICGFVAESQRSLIHADEVWHFPGPPKVELTDIRPLCVKCHDAKDYSDFLRRSAQGIASPSRALSIIEHYCSVNNCSIEEFDLDFKIALQIKNEKEKIYRFGFDGPIVVDFGKWGRPANKPILTISEKRLVKNLYVGRDGPIIIQGVSLSNFSSAVRYLQALSLDERGAVIKEMQGG